MPPRRRRIHRSRKSRKPILIVGFLVAVAAVIIVAYIMIGTNSPSGINYSGKRVLLITSMGSITIALRDDMPITTGNFKNLTEQGIYDNTIFHRVIADFMIQGGNPTGTGNGDPSIPAIPDEFTSNNRNDRGTVAMANAGPNTGSSQFFINVVNNNHLDTKHPVFGKVIDGMDVVDAISKVSVVADPITGEKSRPAENITLIMAKLID